MDIILKSVRINNFRSIENMEVTAHMSKGLQYEVVFVVGLSEGTFPDYRAVSAGTKEMEQEKNNMFVAATRAKRLCYFTYPKLKKMPWGDTKIQKNPDFWIHCQLKLCRVSLIIVSILLIRGVIPI